MEYSWKEQGGKFFLRNIRRICGGYKENIGRVYGECTEYKWTKSISDEENIRNLSLSPICIRSSELVLFWIWRKCGAP